MPPDVSVGATQDAAAFLAERAYVKIFPFKYARVPHKLLFHDPPLGLPAVGVYAALARYANKDSKFIEVA